MKLRETSDEFENTKHSSAGDKLSFAEKRLSALKHQVKVLDTVKQKFANRFVQRSHVRDLKPEEVAKGYIAFPTVSAWAKNRDSLDIYHSLTPNEIALLTKMYQRYVVVNHMEDDLNKKMSSMKLAAKKENGTYVSRDQMYNYERSFGTEIASMLEKNISEVKASFYYSKTKQAGASILHVKIKDAATPGDLVKSEKKNWKAFLEKIKYTIRTWLEAQGYKVKDPQIRFEYQYRHSVVAGKAEVTQQKAGTLAITVRSDFIVSYYRKPKTGG